ncbi:MAG TPA: SH3 domain-containing protein, partial [Acetobacteraceae bacterium]|nr:SH3 domain-containing protein [Acetobacteraceae bacterium]
SPAPVDGDRVTAKQAANVRVAANGSAAVARTVAQGTEMRVYGRQGGWVQVGDAQQQWGWVHSSLLGQGHWRTRVLGAPGCGCGRAEWRRATVGTAAGSSGRPWIGVIHRSLAGP